MPHGRRGQNLIGPEICGCYLASRVRIIQSWEPSGAQIQAVEHLTEPTGFFSKASSDNAMAIFSFQSTPVTAASKVSLVDFSEEVSSVSKKSVSFDWNSNFVGAGASVKNRKEGLKGLVTEEEKPTLTAREVCELAKKFLGISGSLEPTLGNSFPV